jgi:hypothetical protein
MKDLSKLAKIMESKILETPSNKIVESPLLTKNQAEKLSKDYLFKYDTKMGPINPEFSDISSYVVYVGGVKNA